MQNDLSETDSTTIYDSFLVSLLLF
jgi:hypothetical protein